MKIALAAVRNRNNDIEFNISQMKKYMLEAKSAGADVVCFGEAFLHGFDALTWDFDKDKNIAVSTDSELFDKLKLATTEIGVDLFFGYNELDGEAIYSSAALLSNGKMLYNYRRISRGWKEYSKTDEHYREGDIVETFEYHGLNCAIAICGDLWEAPDRFALGEDVLLWPVYISYTPAEWKGGEHYEYACQAVAAADNVLLVNSISDTNDTFGGSSWFDCGEIREYFEMGKEGLLFVEM